MPKAVLALLFALLLASCGPQAPVPQERPVLGAWIAFEGQSMIPTYPDGGFAEVEFGVSFDALKVGDVVVFWDYKRGKAFTIHRIVAKQGEGFITRGDNHKTNPVADDAWVTRETFYARATGRHATIIYNSAN